MDNPITADKIKEAYPDPSVLAKVIGYRTNEDTSETVDLTNKGAVMEWGNIEVYNDWMALATITAYYDGIRTDAGEEYMFESSYNINFNAY